MTTTIKKTVAVSGGDFTKLSAATAWFHANHQDFVTEDIIGEIEITGSWASADTDYVFILADDLVTDATHYLYIHATGAARHSGKWSETAYRLVVTNNIAFRMQIAGIVSGLQIQTVGATSEKYSLLLSPPAGLTIQASDLIVRGDLTASVPPTLCVCGGSGTTYLWNIIGYDAGTYSLLTDGSASLSVYCYNSVFIGGSTAGVRRNVGTLTAKNVYAGGSTTSDYYGTMTKVTCASSDSSGSEGLRGIAVNTDTFTNVTSGSQDFHLVSSRSSLFHVGTDTSGDDAPMNFTKDIDGDDYYDTDGKRSIGADEVVETPPSAEWVEYFTPYTYPHPLRNESGGTPPTPPPPVVIEESNYFDLSDSIGASIIIHAKGENESANGTITFIFSFYKQDINGVWSYSDSDPYVISLNGINDVCATFVIPNDVRKIQLKSIEYDDDETHSALVNVTLNKLCFDNFEQADSLVSSLKAVINEQKRPKV